MHYARWKKHGDPLHEMRRYVRQDDQCTIEGCTRTPHGRGLCSVHYDRIRTHGETTDPRERKFWAQVDKRGPDDCWPWTGAVQGGGYGTFGATGGRLAHRVAYEYVIGPIPKSLVLDHLCHTRDPQCSDGVSCVHRRCCNFLHLEPVSRRENVRRGRSGDSWGYTVDPGPAKPRQLALPVCVTCGGTEKPIYKSGKCRPCYRKWLKDPDVKRPSTRTREERFWEKVYKRGPVPDQRPELGRCWLWIAGINGGTGYGMFSIRHGQMMDAHRFSYLLAHGAIPEGHDVHHLCYVRRCVRPEHLQALLPRVNRTDRKYRRNPAA
jgi:hypothetical protein